MWARFLETFQTTISTQLDNMVGFTTGREPRKNVKQTGQWQGTTAWNWYVPSVKLLERAEKTLSSPIGKLTISRKLRPVDSAVHTLACPWSSTNHSTQSVQLLRFLCRFKPMIHRALFSLFKLLSYLTESPGHRVFSGNPPGNHFPFVFWRWIANGQCRRLGSLQRAAHRCRHGVQSLGETGISEL